MIRIKSLIRNVFSRPLFQPLFEKILNFSLKVMNIGEGQTVETSGEKTVFEVLKKITRNEKAVIFDIGAHTGEWFEYFDQNYHGDFIVFSFEPSADSFSLLSKINKTGFHPVNLALGNEIGKKYLSYDNKGDTTAFVSNEKNSSKASDEINVITLDHFCREKNIENIDLLKLDVEGYELKVLAGAKKMLEEKRVKLIQFEFGAPSLEKYSFKEFYDLLSGEYQICRILKNGYFPLKKYNHYYEILTCTNFIAIRKDLLNQL